MLGSLLAAALIGLLVPATALAAPETAIESGPTGTTADNTPTFTFSSDDPLATFECRVDGEAFAACTSPIELAELTDGLHTFRVRAIDTAPDPDPSPASQEFTVDTTAPDTAIDSGPTGVTADNTPTFAFSSDDPGATFECRVDDALFTPCSSPTTTAALNDGEHTFEVQATDAVGNTESGPATRTFTVDATPPTTTIDSGPTGSITDTTPTFTFSSGDPGATFQCRVDEESFAPCSSPRTTAALDDGEHTFEVRAIDGVGNADPTPDTRTFTVDTTPPTTTIDSGPTTTGDTTPTFTFSSDDPAATFQCRVDAAAFTACSSPATLAALADGDYTFAVRATDAVGNTDASPATQAFTIDTVNPDTLIDSGPDGATSDTTPTFAFSATKAGSTFECGVDGGGFGACSGPGATHTPATPLSEGLHTFQVRATDPLGHTDPSPANQVFTVDTIAPDMAITKRPKGKVKTKKKTADVKVAFASEQGVTYACKVDGGQFKACVSPFETKVSAKAGKGRKHTISVRATDEAGNVGDVSSVAFRAVRKRLLRAPVAERTVKTALKRHGFANRVVRAVRVDCRRSNRSAFKCSFSVRFPGYRLNGNGDVNLGVDLSYRFRVSAQGVKFTLTDENEG